ncbi:hypothetical protein [Agrobacterium bohemicum]|uniref:hypothetical protein n=1 Tax=Agrobacterium bohemicum TaxID=2052828 RepID=UPI000ACF9FA6|nr:hypothetical protein [Agrobacterium bohemicum]
MTPFTLSLTDTGPRVLDIELARWLGVDNLGRFQRHIFLTVAHAFCIADSESPA